MPVTRPTYQVKSSTISQDDQLPPDRPVLVRGYAPHIEPEIRQEENDPAQDQ